MLRHMGGRGDLVARLTAAVVAAGIAAVVGIAMQDTGPCERLKRLQAAHPEKAKPGLIIGQDKSLSPIERATADCYADRLGANRP